MILIKYVTKLPMNFSFASLLELDQSVSNRLRVFADKIETLEDCTITKDYDETTNTYTIVYEWTSQEAIDAFYTWANVGLARTNETYQGVLDQYTALVESVDGTVTRTTQVI